jgi:hypothetical protein
MLGGAPIRVKSRATDLRAGWLTDRIRGADQDLAQA